MLELIDCQIKVKNKNVISNLNLQLDLTKISAILGPNGTGKSTLFKTIIGQNKLTQGSIKLNGQLLETKDLKSRIQAGLAYLPQGSSIFTELTVAENLLAAAENFETYAEVGSIIDKFQLQQIAQKKASTLSGGQKRITEIARCMVTKPKCLLLDEPFAGIDPKTILLIQTILAEVKASGVGVVITDHQAEKTMTMADDIIILNQGKIIARGSAKIILQDKNVIDTYLGQGPNFS